jgi:hypothetical protein
LAYSFHSLRLVSVLDASAYTTDDDSAAKNSLALSGAAAAGATTAELVAPLPTPTVGAASSAVGLAVAAACGCAAAAAAEGVAGGGGTAAGSGGAHTDDAATPASLASQPCPSAIASAAPATEERLIRRLSHHRVRATTGCWGTYSRPLNNPIYIDAVTLASNRAYVRFRQSVTRSVACTSPDVAASAASRRKLSTASCSGEASGRGMEAGIRERALDGDTAVTAHQAVNMAHCYQPSVPLHTLKHAIADCVLPIISSASISIPTSPMTVATASACRQHSSARRSWTTAQRS